MFVKKILALDLELGLEGSFLGGSGGFLLVQFLLVEISDPAAFLGQLSGFCGESFLDTFLDGVNGLGGSGVVRLGLGLAVTGSGTSHVEASSVDGGGEVDGSAGDGGLTGDEGGRELFVVEELVCEAFTGVVQDVPVRGADGRAGALGRWKGVGVWLAGAAATGGAVCDQQHGVADLDPELLLPELGEGGELHGLGNGLHPLHGAVHEESVLGVRRRHGGRVKTCYVK